MALHIAGREVEQAFLGGRPVREMWLGSIQVWPSDTEAEYREEWHEFTSPGEQSLIPPDWAVALDAVALSGGSNGSWVGGLVTGRSAGGVAGKWDFGSSSIDPTVAMFLYVGRGALNGGLVVYGESSYVRVTGAEDVVRSPQSPNSGVGGEQAPNELGASPGTLSEFGRSFSGGGEAPKSEMGMSPGGGGGGAAHGLGGSHGPGAHGAVWVCFRNGERP